MKQLYSVSTRSDIPAKHRDTPIGLLLEYHNLKRPFDNYSQAHLMISICMDNRIQLQMPENFAFILRTGGANLRFNEFQVSHAIAIGNVESFALIGHTQCGMVNLCDRRAQFVKGLVDATGWENEKAEEYFLKFSPQNEIVNEVDFVISEAERFRLIYPKINIVPILYRVEDHLLYLL